MILLPWLLVGARPIHIVGGHLAPRHATLPVAAALRSVEPRCLRLEEVRASDAFDSIIQRERDAS